MEVTQDSVNVDINSEELVSSFSSEECPEDSQISDLVELIRRLQELKTQEELEQQKIVDSAKMLSKNLIELEMLRCVIEDTMQVEVAKNDTAILCLVKIMEMEREAKRVKFEACVAAETLQVLRNKNAQITADVEARLDLCKLSRALKEALQRERKCVKKLDEIEIQNSCLLAECDEEKQRILQVPGEVLQLEKEGEEWESKWRQAIKEKEQLYILLAQEMNEAETQKANARAKLSMRRQKHEMEMQVAKDELSRLEDKLSNISTADDKSSGLDGESSQEPIYLRKCIICMNNEVCVVFLPCAHQVTCLSCSEVADGCCPYCKVPIDQSIKVFGFMS